MGFPSMAHGWVTRGLCSVGSGGAAGAGGVQVADAGGDPSCAQPHDFLVLGGQPRQRELLELQQAGGGRLGCVQAFLEAVVAGFECGDLRVPRIGVLPASRGLGDLLFELLLQVGVAAVEGGAGYAGLAGQGGDVAVAARRDAAGQEGGARGTDALLDLAALGVGDSDGYRPSGAAASMASTTR